ncbi:MAG: entericidin A/B family lipoprotein [Opitutales bacterium]
MKKLIVSLFVSASLLAFSACQTTEGFGEDVEDAGEGIQDAAN